MKLAEALALRADLKKRIDQVECRLVLNAKVQEGEAPAEDPEALLAEPLTGQLLGRLAGSVLLTELDGQAEAGYRIPTPQLSDFSAPLARSYEIYFAVTFADEPPAPDTPATPSEPELPEEPSEPPQAEPAWAPKGAVHWV